MIHDNHKPSCFTHAQSTTTQYALDVTIAATNSTFDPALQRVYDLMLYTIMGICLTLVGIFLVILLFTMVYNRYCGWERCFTVKEDKAHEETFLSKETRTSLVP